MIGHQKTGQTPAKSQTLSTRDEACHERMVVIVYFGNVYMQLRDAVNEARFWDYWEGLFGHIWLCMLLLKGWETKKKIPVH